ncbi:MAG: CoA ester lyase [Rickettsiales bacterium]|nr:CoA ester lyase [Rickettsiales bacterium]
MVKGLTRSALYVPTDHDRAMAKTNTLDCDILIFDLEDGVAPDKKAYGRQAIVTASERKAWANFTVIVRINHHSTPYYEADIETALTLPIDGIMLSKVSGPEDVDKLVHHTALAERADLAIWCNVETPRGVINAFDIANHPNVHGIVVGTNDLANDLRVIRKSNRGTIMGALQQLVIAARAAEKTILDGTFIDLEDHDGLKAEAKQGREMGFDGKTLIHPKQIPATNTAFAPRQSDIDYARKVINIYEEAMKAGKAVTLVDGKMIEKLHYDRAVELLETVKKSA